jgi:HEAT repeat protein
MGEQYSPLLAGEGQGERFACAEESQRGEELLRKLQEPGKERIRELVRNPLRLSLLCQTSYVLPVDEPLPETKAALYERFTRYFYEWKQEQHLDLTQQDELIDELHEALGKLALAGINSAARFRLGRKFARQEMGERLFNLACRLGWLNLVDREAKTDEAVYAFFHPTFQEYFAACAIDDWRKDFLNHVPDNPMQGTYRIFEPQWKEVILLWLGREDVAKEQKEEFIWVLGRFDDKCGGFYWFRAFFLAAAGVAEFKDCPCSWIDEIVTQIVKWSLGDGGITGYKLPEPIAEAAKAALKETDSQTAIAALVKLIENNSDKFSCIEAATLLGSIDKDNKTAINYLIKLIQEPFNDKALVKAMESLGQIGKNNSLAMNTLVEIIKKPFYDYFTGRFATNDYLTMVAAQNLLHIDNNNELAITTLWDLIHKPEFTRFREAISSLAKFCKNNPIIKAKLLKLIDEIVDESVLLQVASILFEIDNKQISNKEYEILKTKLSKLITLSKNPVSIIKTANILLNTGSCNQLIIDTLTELIKNNQDSNILLQATYILGKIDNNNQIAQEALLRLCNNEQEKRTLQQIDFTLGGTIVTVDLGERSNESIRAEAAFILEFIYKKDESDIQRLAELIRKFQNEDSGSQAAHFLGTIDKNNRTAIATLVELIANSQTEYSCWQAADRLRDILTEAHSVAGVVARLKDYLNRRHHCYEFIWDCAQILPYRDFYQAWHQTTIHEKG